MRALTTLYLFASAILVVSCFPQIAQQPPIILITAPLEPGEVIVLGDESQHVEIMPEVKQETPAAAIVEGGSSVNSTMDGRKPPKPSKPGNRPQKPGNRPQKPGNKPQKPGNRPQKPGNKPQKPGKPKPQKPSQGKPSNGRPSKPSGNRPQRPSKPNKPGKPQNKPNKPSRPQRPLLGSEEDLKTETTTFDYDYDFSSTTEFDDTEATTPLPEGGTLV